MPVTAKKADVAVRLAWNSASIEVKNTPKLYIVPNATKPAMKADRAASQPANESGASAPAWSRVIQASVGGPRPAGIPVLALVRPEWRAQPPSPPLGCRSKGGAQ